MSLLKWRSNAPFMESDRKLNFFTMLSTHIQLILGLILYFLSTKVHFSGDTMKVAVTRFFTVEHSILMLLAIALVTIGYTKSKKAAEDTQKFRTAFIYFLIALVVILVAIPWPFRGFGSGWF
jgi:cytochrome c biogenesis factor